MRFSLFLSLATALVVQAAPLVSVTTTANAFADADLELIAPELVRQMLYAAAPPDTPPPAPAAANHTNGTSTTAANLDANTTTCGAFESAADNTSMYVAVTALFVVPKVSSRPLFDWKKDPGVTPRIAVSAGVDGIGCPASVRAGIYATVYQNGTQQHVPFVQFDGHVYAVRIATVAPGEHVRVRVTIVQDDIVNIKWTNANRTDQAFDKNVSAGGQMCGKTVSWFVEDLVPYKASPGDYFAAFEPVRFRLLEGERMDGNTVHFDSSTANFTTENTLCKVDQAGTEMTVTST